MSTRVDNELIERCANDDQVAWRDLVSRYQRLVYSVANAVCPRPEDASDVFQQVWMDLYRQVSLLRDPEALPAWLITVTRRRAFQILRSQRPVEQLSENIPDLSYTLVMIEKEHAVERGMKQLPERCQHLIKLLYFTADEPSYNQISKQMDIPVASIGATRTRCLQKLRKFLG